MTDYSEPERYLEWAAKRIGISAFRSDARAIGLERDGDLVAAAVYDTFSPGTCLMHIASDGSGRWLNRDFLFRMFAYPFIQCGFRRVTGLISASNAASLRFARHIGFQDEGVLREEAPDGDVIVLGMLRRECKWIAED
jgi:RimJ/RimL family protein N-acetyltransferase